MATILVVDDEVVFCELLKTLLKGHGQDVLTANNGREALELFKQHRPRCTMLDLRMLQAGSVRMVHSMRETREALSRSSTQRGCQVRVAKYSPASLESVAREKPQLVVMDMDLPGLKGIEVLRTLRGKNYTGGFVMMTANEDDALLKAALELGSADILGKPVEPERLLVAIQVGLVLLH